MKALVISDSHGASARMAQLMEAVVPKEKPQTLVFCGDGLHDIRPYGQLFERVLAVRGNCDLSAPQDTPVRLLTRIGSLDMLVVHGHQYHVKRDPHTLLLYAGLEAGAGIICFGHTHVPMAEWQRGVLLLNPGALRDGCYALLQVGPAGEISFSLCRLSP